jgi:hypothetical protein
MSVKSHGYLDEHPNLKQNRTYRRPRVSVAAGRVA